MKARYFKDLNEYEKATITTMCEAIESKKLHIVCTTNKYKMLVTASNGYTYDYTYNLCRWGFARKSRNNDQLAILHPYTPCQYISTVLSNFLNRAVEMGFYTRKTTEVFNGGCDFQIIWLS